MTIPSDEIVQDPPNGIKPVPTSYIIFTDGVSIFAKNGFTGIIDFSGATWSTVVQSSITALVSGGLISVKAGTYTATTTIPNADVSANVMITGEGTATIINQSGGIDAINTDFIQAKDLVFQDKNSVSCDLTINQKRNLERLSSLPIINNLYRTTNSAIKYLGNYIRISTTGATLPSTGTVWGFSPRSDANRTFRVLATVLCKPNTSSFFPLMSEPFKSNFNEFFGFLCDPAVGVRIKSRTGGIETETIFVTAAGFFDVEHIYQIDYGTDQIQYYIDGILRATHVTNISTIFPREIEAAEINGITGTDIYLKHPFIQIQDGGT